MQVIPTTSATGSPASSAAASTCSTRTTTPPPAWCCSRSSPAVGEQRAAGDRGLLPGPALGARARDVPGHPAVRRQRARPQGSASARRAPRVRGGPEAAVPLRLAPWTRLSATPSSGSVLDGRYHVGPRLARGGMATVYEAHDNRLDRTIALKVMHPSLADDEEFVSRFIREAHSAARLSHPNVVAVYDQGADQGHVFLAMEHVRGRTLRDLIREQRPPQPPPGARGARAGARRARRRPPGRPRAPRRQARERPALRRRPGQGRRLRPGPRRVRRHQPHHHHRRPDGHRRLPLPRAGRARRGRPALRRLRRRHPALRDAHRQPSRTTARPPSRSPTGTCTTTCPPPSSLVPGLPAELDAPGRPGHQPRPRRPPGRRPPVPRRGGRRPPGAVRRRARHASARRCPRLLQHARPHARASTCTAPHRDRRPARGDTGPLRAIGPRRRVRDDAAAARSRCCSSCSSPSCSPAPPGSIAEGPRSKTTRPVAAEPVAGRGRRRRPRPAASTMQVVGNEFSEVDARRTRCSSTDPGPRRGHRQGRHHRR